MGSMSLQIEALLVASASPISLETLGKLYPEDEVRSALEELRACWRGRGMSLVVKGDVVSLSPAPDALRILSEVQGEKVRSLSTAAVETLCYIAMHQPVSLSDIESGRGIKLFKGLMDSLLDSGFVRSAVRRSDSGRAITYVTTDAFLEHFGLASLSDLPTVDELPELVGPPVD